AFCSSTDTFSVRRSGFKQIGARTLPAVSLWFFEHHFDVGRRNGVKEPVGDAKDPSKRSLDRAVPRADAAQPVPGPVAVQRLGDHGLIAAIPPHFALGSSTD